VATVLLVLSVGANAVMLLLVLLLAGTLGAHLGAGPIDDGFQEHVVERGPARTKIAVVRVAGLIADNLTETVRQKLDRARRDDDVVAVILRINSPGGYLTASDALYHHVQVFAEETGKPVVAAMDGVAASGGYYAACAADQIVAQRTTVTGSIGIVAQYFFLNELMEDKLGIQSVTLKRGQQKDWPNMFSGQMTAEQRDYIMEALLDPGYDQFVDVVAEARGMDRADVLSLATGRIFMGPEARERGLVDEIGYFGRAVEIARDRAGVAEAKVVEYVRPFGLMNIFGMTAKAESLLDVKPETLGTFSSPRAMYLWTGL
jgi:protease-4